MRIFHHASANIISVEGTHDVYPSRSLTYQHQDGKIVLILVGNQRRIAGPMDWTMIRNEAGEGFATEHDLVLYLQQELSKDSSASSGTGGAGGSAEWLSIEW